VLEKQSVWFEHSAHEPMTEKAGEIFAAVDPVGAAISTARSAFGRTVKGNEPSG
jgi:hypothetical protein